jgi:hypothetical protein
MVMPSVFRDNRAMALPEHFYEPSPGPWAFHELQYGLNNVLLDRDGHHLCSHIRCGDGPVMAAAPAMVDLLNDIIDGADLDHVRCRAACILREIAQHRPREPGEDDE